MSQNVWCVDLGQGHSALCAWLKSLPEHTVVCLLEALHSCFGQASLDADVSDASQLLGRLLRESGLSPLPELVEVQRLQERQQVSEKFQDRVQDLQQDNNALRQQLSAATCQLEQLVEHADHMVSLKSDEVIRAVKTECMNLKAELDAEKANKRADLLDSTATLHRQHIDEITRLTEKINEEAAPVARQLSSLVKSHVDEISLDFGRRLDTLLTLVDTLAVNLKAPIFKLEAYVDKFSAKESSNKGRAMEDKMYGMMCTAFPQCEVDLCRDSSHSMDIRLTMADGTKILVDVKNYSHNVSNREIKKFHEDIAINRCAGMLLSVGSGIAAKSNMQIDIIDNRFPAVYLHDVKEDMDLVIAATNVITSVNKLVGINEGEVKFDSDTLRLLTEGLKKLHDTARYLRDNNEKQRRLIADFETEALINILTGARVSKQRQSASSRSINTCHVEGDAAPDQTAEFCGLALTRDSGGCFTLKEAVAAWEYLKQSGHLSTPCPSLTLLKDHLQRELSSKYIAKKSVCGTVKYGVISGYTIKPEFAGAASLSVDITGSVLGSSSTTAQVT